MKNLSVQNIEEKPVLTQGNNIEKQVKVAFISPEFSDVENKTITLKGQGSLKALSGVK